MTMKLNIKNLQGQDQGEVEVQFQMIDNGKGTQAVHDVVVAYNAAQRSGTACTKTVGEVAGTNRKPWRQKGTGRARAGSFRSPLWRGGGVVFGPKPRDYSKRISRQTKKAGLRKALSERLKAGDVLIISDLNLPSHKTKELLAVLATLEVNGTVLVVDSAVNKNLLLASRNIPHVDVTTGSLLNTYEVLRNDRLIFTRAAFEQVESRLRQENT